MLTRNAARAAFHDAGLTYAILTPDNLRDLRRCIDQKLRASGLIKNTFRMRKTKELRCRSFYFDDREAVTFNRDGFIGFAGWAGNENVQPILEGFIEWTCSIASGLKGGSNHGE